MRIAANGITFNCRIDGPENAPWLVFSNSLATDLSLWDDQAAHFRTRFRVLRYDQRGHGSTDAPDGRYSFDTLIDDVVALMDVLDIGRAHFCGLSMGGATGMGLAQRHPGRLDRVIVCDTPCTSTPALAQQWEERIATARAHGMAAMVESTLARWFPPQTLAKNLPRLAKLRQMILTTPVNGFIGCCAALADHDFRSAVSAVRRPVLFVVGEYDAPKDAMRQLHHELPGSRFVELPGAGHISNLDQPAMFTRALDEFLGEPSKAGA